jgi:hypothetical protein
MVVSLMVRDPHALPLRLMPERGLSIPETGVNHIFQ